MATITAESGGCVPEQRVVNARARRTAVALFLLCLCIYLIGVDGRLNCLDGVFMYQVTESLVDNGSVAIRSDALGSRGTDGRHYSRYGPMQSLAAVPLYVVGRATAAALQHRLHPEIVKMGVVSLFNPVVTAMLSVLVLYLSLELGYSLKRATAVSLLTAFGSPFLYYTKTFFSEPLTAVLLVAAFWLLVRAVRTGGNHACLIAGICLGGALATRHLAAAAFPAYIVYVWCNARDRRRALVSLLGPIAFAALCLAVYNAHRFGSPLDSGYRGVGFTTPFVYGAAGLLVSPRCGTVYYCPLAIVGLVGLWRLSKERKREGAALTIMCTLWFAAVSCWWCWWGDAWGPRLLLPMVPFLVLASVRVLPRVQIWNPVYSAWAVFIITNVGVQLLPWLVSTVWVDYSIEAEQSNQSARLWSFAYMPLTWQAGHVWHVFAREQWRNVQRADLLGADTHDPTAKYSQGAFHPDQQTMRRADMRIPDLWPFYLRLLGVPIVVVSAMLAPLLVGAAASARSLARALRPMRKDIRLRRVLTSAST